MKNLFSILLVMAIAISSQAQTFTTTSSGGFDIESGTSRLLSTNKSSKSSTPKAVRSTSNACHPAPETAMPFGSVRLPSSASKVGLFISPRKAATASTRSQTTAAIHTLYG